MGKSIFLSDESTHSFKLLTLFNSVRLAPFNPSAEALGAKRTAKAKRLLTESFMVNAAIG